MAQGIARKRVHAGRRSARRHGDDQELLKNRNQPADAPKAAVYRLDGSLAPASVLQLQNSIGNSAYNRASHNPAPIQRLFGRKKKAAAPASFGVPTVDDPELKKLKDKAGSDQDAKEDQLGETESTMGEDIQEGVGFGAELTGAAGEPFSNFGGETDRMHGDSISFGTDTAQGANSAVGSGLGAGGAALGVGAGGVGMVLAIMKLKELAKSNEEGKGWEIADVSLALAGSLNQMGVGGLQAVAGLTGAAGSGAAAAGKEVGSTIADAAGGATEALGALGGLIETGLGTASGCIKVAQMIAGKSWNAELASGALQDFLKALKGVTVMVKSCIGAANAFMSVAGAAVAIVPIIGAAINIVAQLIDILIQLADMGFRLYKVVKAVIAQRALNKFKQVKATATDMKEFAGYLAGNAKKRWQRQVAPLTANIITILGDFVSIGASVLNIVGAATAAAYGAGVGIMAGGYALSAGSAAMKIGAALIKPTQAAARWGKQKLRNAGGGTDDTGAALNAKRAGVVKFGSAIGINMQKTTTFKNKEMAKQISFIMKHVKSLPDLPAPSDQKYGAAKASYEEAYFLVKSTGVSMKKLTDSSLSQPEAVKLFAAAMRNRG
ncbi:MAG: hypothetical protein AB7N24_02530 [Dehalococcoidia bacterium]